MAACRVCAPPGGEPAEGPRGEVDVVDVCGREDDLAPLDDDILRKGAQGRDFPASENTETRVSG